MIYDHQKKEILDFMKECYQLIGHYRLDKKLLEFQLYLQGNELPGIGRTFIRAE